MKYLVVDDSKIGRKMTIKALKALINENDEILQASNGQEAIELYKEQTPDVCFMDLTMPVLDGFEATLNIKNYDDKAKIIIISADIQESSMQKAKDNGALGFIKKPISNDKLKALLEKIGI